MLVISVVVLGYMLELVNEKRRLEAQIHDYLLRGPPPGCRSMDADERSWIASWILGSPRIDVHACDEYVRVISQMPWPNPFRVAVYFVSDIVVVPTQRIVDMLLSSLGSWLLIVVVVSIALVLLLRFQSTTRYHVLTDPTNSYRYNYQHNVVEQC